MRFPPGVPFASMDVVMTLTNLMEVVRSILLRFKSDFGPPDPLPPKPRRAFFPLETGVGAGFYAGSVRRGAQGE